MRRKQFLWILILFIALSSSIFSQGVSNQIQQIRDAIAQKGASWIAAPTNISKLSLSEKKRLCGTILGPRDSSEAVLLRLPKKANLPSFFDWRDNGGNWVTPVKQQGDCGSCWDFSAVAQVESWWKIFNSNPDSMIDLSEQQVLSCTDGSCDGWYVEGALDYFMNEGVASEECFVYEAEDTIPCSDRCDEWESEAVKIPGWGYVTLIEASVDNIKNAVYRHPVSAGMMIYSDFSYYSGGVYEHTTGAELGGHAILIIGWSDADSCWICKNSWGEYWGENTDFQPYWYGGGGYFRIKWGECGIGQYIPFVYDGSVGASSLSVSPDTLSFSITKGDSVSAFVTVENSGDGTLEFSLIDYEIPCMFHPDTFNSYDGVSWWCGDPEIGGYDNHWLQYLDTPVLDLSGCSNPKLTFKGYWAIESPENPQFPYDGWDGCNVWISTDGGSSFTVLTDVTPQYNCQHLWSFGHPDQGWNMGYDIAGWGGSSGGWISVNASLSSYISDKVVIRFGFASDLGWCTKDDQSLYGFFVDNIKIEDNGTEIFFDSANDNLQMRKKGFGMMEAEWIELIGGVGTVPPHNTLQVPIIIRTSGLDVGYYYGAIQVLSNDTTQNIVRVPVNLTVKSPTSVDQRMNKEGPERWRIVQNYPNPFNSTTEIIYEIGSRSHVEITIYNSSGQRIRTLVDGVYEAGTHRISWNGEDRNGVVVSSGLYFVYMKAGGHIKSRKIVLLR